MSSSKFAASRRPGKTPAICRKAVKPKPATIPDSGHPIIHPKPLMCSIQWKSINPGHPWQYSERQRLTYVGAGYWTTSNSLDSNFTIQIIFFYNHLLPAFHLSSTVNHQNHGDHYGSSPTLHYAGGNAFYIPRLKLDTSPYPRYQCNVSISI